MPKAKHAPITPPEPAAVTPTTPVPLSPVVPSGMPSIWDLAMLAKQCSTEADRIDTTPSRAWVGCAAGLGPRRKAEALDFAHSREDAIVALIETLPAEDARDAVVLLAYADRHLDTLIGLVDPADGPSASNALTVASAIKEMRDIAHRLQRILTNVVPVIANEAGLFLAEIDSTHLENRRAILFAPPDPSWVAVPSSTD